MATPGASPDTPREPITGEQRERIARVIELMRPAIQADGGDVELVEVSEDGIVTVRLHGACVGCPSSEITLQGGIERNLRAHVPQVAAVRAID
ncbi:MAG: NifU family protein [Phycisphaerales bacterium JB037]